MVRQIIVNRTENTTPIRKHDFRAYFADDCEDGESKLVGYGTTEAEAVNELIAFDEEENG